MCEVCTVYVFYVQGALLILIFMNLKFDSEQITVTNLVNVLSQTHYACRDCPRMQALAMLSLN